MSSNRKYLIAFQIWIVNSLILAYTLPPRRLKPSRDFSTFTQSSDLQISWSLVPVVTVLSVPFCKNYIFRKVKIPPVVPHFRLTGLVCLGKKVDVWPEGEWGNSLAQLMLLRLKASPEDCRSTSPGHKPGTTLPTEWLVYVSLFLRYCCFVASDYTSKKNRASVRRN